MSGRVLMIAGEASGDLHGAGVVRALKAFDPAVEVYGIGGDRMSAEGMEIVVHISRLAFMGFWEVVKNLGTVREVDRELDALLDARRPDVVLLIDYPGFNLRFAHRVAQRGIPVVYYISPQVWAWHKGRVKKMKGVVEKMHVVLPFEVDIYRKEGIDVEFVGHPIVEQIGTTGSRDEFCKANGIHPSSKILALLPGSRLQEIEHILPYMAEAAHILCRSGDICPVLGVAPNLGRGPMREHLARYPEILQVEHATHDLMAHADAAIVTSGTATLETGWFGTPMVIVYKTSPVTYAIGRMLVDVPYIGLVNIVAGSKVVPELIQHDLTTENIVREVAPILNAPAVAAAYRGRLAVVKERLGARGASEKVAQSLLSHLKVA